MAKQGPLVGPPQDSSSPMHSPMHSPTNKNRKSLSVNVNTGGGVSQRNRSPSSGGIVPRSRSPSSSGIAQRSRSPSRVRDRARTNSTISQSSGQFPFYGTSNNTVNQDPFSLFITTQILDSGATPSQSRPRSPLMYVQEKKELEAAAILAVNAHAARPYSAHVAEHNNARRLSKIEQQEEIESTFHRLRKTRERDYGLPDDVFEDPLFDVGTRTGLKFLQAMSTTGLYSDIKSKKKKPSSSSTAPLPKWNAVNGRPSTGSGGLFGGGSG
eukprot:gene42442-52633_t